LEPFGDLGVWAAEMKIIARTFAGIAGIGRGTTHGLGAATVS
jgi:hypothetical protein